MWNKKIGMMMVLSLIMPLCLTGCFFEDKPSGAIDPPPQKEVQKLMDAEAVQAKQVKSEQKRKGGFELYFFSDKGYVVPYSLDVHVVNGIAKESLKNMVKGGPSEGKLPKGFSPVLPKGTTIKGLNIQDGTMTVDFSKEFLNYEAKQEEKMLNAVTWSLTGFKNVKEVNVWVEGRPLLFMPKGKTPAQGLTRQRGINLEVSQGVNVTQSMPVTLYFIGQTVDHHIYYVPVTRMINRVDNVAEAVVKELAKGPAPYSKLFGSIAASTQINSVKVQGDMVVADLAKPLTGINEDRSEAKAALDSMVFSLTENILAKKVKITVNGSAKASGESISTPVTRPQAINPVGL